MANEPDRVKELLAKPSAEGLSYLLRHSEIWPKDFKWNFGNYYCCALGLSEKFWGYKFNVLSNVEFYFKITYERGAGWVFGSGILNIYGKPDADVTPNDVADKLDELARNSR